MRIQMVLDMASFCWPERMLTMPSQYPEEFRDQVANIVLEIGSEGRFYSVCEC